MITYHVLIVGLPVNKPAIPIGHKACVMPELLEYLTDLGELGVIEDTEHVTDNLVREWIEERTWRSTDYTCSHVDDVLLGVSYRVDNNDPECETLSFLTDVMIELWQSGVQHVIDELPKKIIQQPIPKL